MDVRRTRQHVATGLFGRGDELVRSALGYATVRFSYDDLGRESKREFFDVNGAPVRTNVTIEKLEPDGTARRVGAQVMDQIVAYDGEHVPDTRVFEELELVKGERPANSGCGGMASC